jgi:hypothetical protein
MGERAVAVWQGLAVGSKSSGFDSWDHPFINALTVISEMAMSPHCTGLGFEFWLLS